MIFSWSIFAFDVFAIWPFTVQDHIYGRSNFGFFDKIYGQNLSGHKYGPEL